MTASVDLGQYGVTKATEVVHNPSYGMLSEEGTKPILEGYRRDQVSKLGTVSVMTSIYTDRSPKDRFVVVDESSKDAVWWTTGEYKNDNHPASQEAWDTIEKIAPEEFSNKRLLVVGAFCEANKDTRMVIRFIIKVV